MGKELVADPERKKAALKKLCRSNYQIGVYFSFLKVFSLIFWVGPILVCLVQLVKVFVFKQNMDIYDGIVILSKCMILFCAFGLGKVMLQALVNKLTGGMNLENEHERITIDDRGNLTYYYVYNRHRILEKFSLFDVEVKINDDVRLLSFMGRIAFCEEKKDGSMTAPKSKQTVYLVDYYTPGLIETIQSISGGEQK